MARPLGSRAGLDLAEMGDASGSESEATTVASRLWLFREVAPEFVVEGSNEMVCNSVTVVVLVAMLCDAGKDVSGRWLLKAAYL